VNEFATGIREQGGAVLLSTHDLARAVGVADRQAHIADGLISELPLEEPLRRPAGGFA
jgi:ABC-type Mn2+/Zn2+ transport system ATPase subunit